MARLQQLMTELRRRRVFRAAGIYVVAAWVVVQVTSLVFPAIDVPDAAIRYVWTAALLLFPLALVFAWFYEITSSGMERTPPAEAASEVDLSLRRLDFLIIGALAVVGLAIGWQLSTDIRDFSLNSRIESATGDIDPNSIAVLPLENLSDDPEQQYFVSGMQNALISGLSRISALKVTSKTSTMRFSDSVESLPNIAAQLGVAKLIEGSIFRVGNRVRISVQLVDAQADQHIWSETFEDDIEDVLQLQSNVAQAIADQVEVAVLPAGNAQKRLVNPAAYEAYLKGQFHVERYTAQDMMLASQYYQQAIDLDPDYALAHYGLSKLCGFQAQAGVISPEEAKEQCLPLIERALALDDQLPEAHMGYAAHMTWQHFNWDEGDRAFKRALALNPSYAEAHMFYSHFLGIMGRHEESSEEMSLALELDPLNPFVRGLYAVQLLMIDDYQGAVDVVEEVMTTTPGFGFGYNITWQAYHELGENDAAIAAAVNYFRITRGDLAGAQVLEDAYADGDFKGALLQAAQILEELAKTNNVPPMTISTLYEQAGETEKSIDFLELAYQNKDPDAPYMGVLVKSVATRSNPRFIELLRKMKLDYWADLYSQDQRSD